MGGVRGSDAWSGRELEAEGQTRRNERGAANASREGAAHALEQNPPDTNRGVPSASILLDYLCLTCLNDSVPWRELVPLVPADDWIELEHGAMGYNRAFQCGHITVFTEGRPGMGTHVRISGQGCRELEGRGLTDWRGYWLYLHRLNCHLTRWDSAFDDYQGLLDIDVMEQAFRDGNVTCGWRKGRATEGFTKGESSTISEDGPSKDGKTVYFGASSSDSELRIYDKAKQLGESGPHIRVEQQLRGKRARAFGDALALCEDQSIAQLMAIWLVSAVDFKEPGADQTKSRWKTCSWWSGFLGEVERMQLLACPAKRTIRQVIMWVQHDVAPTLAVLRRWMRTDGAFGELIWSLVENGESRLSSKHLALLSGT